MFFLLQTYSTPKNNKLLWKQVFYNLKLSWEQAKSWDSWLWSTVKGKWWCRQLGGPQWLIQVQISYVNLFKQEKAKGVYWISKMIKISTWKSCFNSETGTAFRGEIRWGPQASRSNKWSNHGAYQGGGWNEPRLGLWAHWGDQKTTTKWWW